MKAAMGGFGRKRSLTCAVMRSSEAEAVKALKAWKPAPAASGRKAGNPASPGAAYHLVMVRQPAGFTPGSFRTIRIGKHGDLATAGRLKGRTTMTVQSYRIPKAHAPTMAAAVGHVRGLKRRANPPAVRPDPSGRVRISKNTGLTYRPAFRRGKAEGRAKALAAIKAGQVIRPYTVKASPSDKFEFGYHAGWDRVAASFQRRRAKIRQANHGCEPLAEPNAGGRVKSWTVHLVGGDLVGRPYTVEARTAKAGERKAIAAARSAGVPVPVKVVRVDRLGVRA